MTALTVGELREWVERCEAQARAYRRESLAGVVGAGQMADLTDRKAALLRNVLGAVDPSPAIVADVQ